MITVLTVQNSSCVGNWKAFIAMWFTSSQFERSARKFHLVLHIRFKNENWIAHPTVCKLCIRSAALSDEHRFCNIYVSFTCEWFICAVWWWESLWTLPRPLGTNSSIPWSCKTWHHHMVALSGYESIMWKISKCKWYHEINCPDAK